jgi:hypothetical protein
LRFGPWIYLYILLPTLLDWECFYLHWKLRISTDFTTVALVLAALTAEA